MTETNNDDVDSCKHACCRFIVCSFHDDDTPTTKKTCQRKEEHKSNGTARHDHSGVRVHVDTDTIPNDHDTRIIIPSGRHCYNTRI
jgi:hypothetical protein